MEGSGASLNAPVMCFTCLWSLQDGVQCLGTPPAHFHHYYIHFCADFDVVCWDHSGASLIAPASNNTLVLQLVCPKELGKIQING